MSVIGCAPWVRRYRRHTRRWSFRSADVRDRLAPCGRSAAGGVTARCRVSNRWSTRPKPCRYMRPSSSRYRADMAQLALAHVGGRGCRAELRAQRSVRPALRSDGPLGSVRDRPRGDPVAGCSRLPWSCRQAGRAGGPKEPPARGVGAVVPVGVDSPGDARAATWAGRARDGTRRSSWRATSRSVSIASASRGVSFLFCRLVEQVVERVPVRRQRVLPAAPGVLHFARHRSPSSKLRT